MNTVTEGILLTAKLIKVKDTVTNLFKLYNIENTVRKYTKKYLDTHNIEDFLLINLEPSILESPIVFCDVEKTVLGVMMSDSFIGGGQVIPNEKTAIGIYKKIKKSSKKLGVLSKSIKNKQVTVFIHFNYLQAETFLEDSSRLQSIVEHEWVHVEQNKRANLKKGKGKDINRIRGKMDNQTKALTIVEDFSFIKRLVKENKKLILSTIDKNSLKGKFISSKFGKKIVNYIIKKNLRRLTGNNMYYSAKVEIAGYAVSAAEAYRRKSPKLNFYLNTYMALGEESPKIKKKFFRLYSEALQERGVPISEISNHVNNKYKEYKIIKDQQAENIRKYNEIYEDVEEIKQED